MNFLDRMEGLDEGVERNAPNSEDLRMKPLVHAVLFLWWEHICADSELSDAEGVGGREVREADA